MRARIRAWFAELLSVAFSLASGGVIPLTASRRAVLSASRQAATLIPSMLLPSLLAPVVKAAWRTGPHAASQPPLCWR